MKIHLLAESLQKKLSFVNHAISSRTDLPILLNILLEAKEGKLYLSSTDLEIGIRTALPAEIETEGGITVPAKTFIELVNSLTSEKITLELNEQTLTVTSKKTRSSFQTIAKEDFPKLFEEKGELLAELPFTSLKEDCSMVVFAASSDSSRPALSGILMRKEPQGFLFVATDGYRLSLKHLGALGDTTTGQKEQLLIVPARVIREALSIKEDEETIKLFVAANSNQVIFQQGETLLIGRLIEAEFPPYAKIIPSDHASQISFDREELLKAVKICSIFAREAANIIKFSLQKDKIIVSTNSPSVGENTVEVEAKLTGEENDIAFNAKYLLDVLSNLSENDLTFEMTGPLNPGVFKVKDDVSFLHLIMPIRVQS